MKDLQTPIPTDTWVTATWDEYIQLVSNPIYDKAKCYYHQGQLRIEMPPVGHDHSSDNTVISFSFLRRKPHAIPVPRLALGWIGGLT
jgi:Uma2 family endonuclease